MAYIYMLCLTFICLSFVNLNMLYFSCVQIVLLNTDKEVCCMCVLVYLKLLCCEIWSSQQLLCHIKKKIVLQCCYMFSMYFAIFIYINT